MHNENLLQEDSRMMKQEYLSADVKVRAVPAVLAFAKDPAAEKAKAAKARAFVQQRQRETMDTLRRSLGID